MIIEHNGTILDLNGLLIDYTPPPTNNIVTSNLIMYLDASNPLSYPGTGTLWTDLSGFGNNGTLINGPTFNSANGGSIVFDGLNDYVDLGNKPMSNITIVDNYTINIWLMGFATNLSIGLVHKGPINGNDYDWMIYLASNASISFYKKNTSGVGSFAVGYFINLNTIVNVCVVLSSNVVSFYKDGVFVTSIPMTGNIRTSSNPLKIGRGWNGSLNGRVYEASIYNRALSETEVLQNFNATRTRFGI